MLPKQEKVPKPKSKKDETAGKTKKSADPQKQHLNRLFVIITLGLTTLLCLSLFLYREIHRRLLAGRSLLPTVNLSLSTLSVPQLAPTTSLDSEINPLIIHSPGVWSIYTELRPNGQLPFIWSRNFDSLEASNLFAALSSAAPSTSTAIATALPQDLPVAEKIDTTNGLLAAYLIRLPQKQIFLIIKNTDKSPDLSVYLPKLVSTIYWNLVDR
ncbi:hypothetical protein M1116_01260 [Patescibacteria group bacterium]|nr:hypothetical protein [Patescibacteria group bacterium]